MDFKECYSDTVSSVAAAARAGCRRRLRTLIHRGCSIDSRDNRGWNALHEAASAGSADCVRELISAAVATSRGGSSYLAARTHEGETALHLAAHCGNLAVVKLLIKARANINQPTNDGSCPLYAAVSAGHKEVVELLIRKGAEVNGEHTSSCWSSLHLAAYKGSSEMVRLLIAVPACKLEALDDNNITPLFLSAQYGRRECLQILIDAGADVNTQAADLATPLMIASQQGYEDCVNTLLAHGANANILCNDIWPQIPIHAAAEFGHISILRRLIAVTDRTCDRGKDRVSPLYLATDQRECTQVLLEEGFHPDAQDCSSFIAQSPLAKALAPLHASSRTPSDSARLLLAAGATLNKAVWAFALNTDKPETLQFILQHRRICLRRLDLLQRPDLPSWGLCSPAQSYSSLSSLEESSVTMSSSEETSEVVCSSDESSQSWSSREPPGWKASRPKQSSGNSSVSGELKDVWLNAEELTWLVLVADRTVHHAPCWLPLLLQAGLEPSLLLRSDILKKAKSDVLNYLLEFVNWSTLSHHLRQILDQRLEEKTWTPNAHLEGVPPLSHLCRLQVREQLGAYPLMQTPCVQQLPLPRPLQKYLQFTDIIPP
ncbi:ankyrin repeat and SOCS box protein 3 [Hypomesus transpacificus]|uniref:ankyrin repeat and SOCS box protein 3 n=1 Tax=Hypomesus transpacificus TaxID=137520 RepID=UPI001F072EAC|nr:ankyrin repeat and SOCS box protein 3 [Hypomesus transpacificus]